MTLTDEEIEQLQALSSKGKHAAQKILNALILLNCDESQGVGRRMTQVTERRTKTDWAHFVEDIAASYPEAQRITLVMDNLNTHSAASLYETFPPDKAKALWDRFECIHTPKHGSWL